MESFLSFTAKNRVPGVLIPRDQMPQFDSEETFVKAINKLGINYRLVTVETDSIKPTQSNYSPEKSNGVFDKNRKLFLANDNYIIDGHHHYTKAVLNNIKQIKAIQVNEPITSILSKLSNYVPRNSD